MNPTERSRRHRDRVRKLVENMASALEATVPVLESCPGPAAEAARRQAEAAIREASPLREKRREDRIA